ncbi:hypothetical protein HBI56_201170 [Parastagonospora nodorum]|uniref:Uncharacterized protein n=1 Tax=Phaeosphaeria nodorum (strain SN15 / ATCC MYA-4574 / FGSC 10173) TaxID=321614 RepID=A0A7U2EW48_PHANO|nr:hypothetical protein HBH56_215720 [Parastagonospora nodorum]QRC93876.1 hypothetical protein JI435_404700 [Parastagonospora nodorum SN15]KAH3922590.1 hypothetical protein HBH54_221790 [Parastagonospora nodorum]KAH3942230.1 hypothetical protein HBH53_191690 [Parastagonospora nodorum]KAH3961336.1 hypothetical protein HBH51_184400 [Parastagonospora nodorum]
MTNIRIWVRWDICTYTVQLCYRAVASGFLLSFVVHIVNAVHPVALLFDWHPLIMVSFAWAAQWGLACSNRSSSDTSTCSWFWASISARDGISFHGAVSTDRVYYYLFLKRHC